MRKYAFINNNIVTKIDSIDNESYLENSRNYQIIVDIEDLVISPEVGWTFNGQYLIPNNLQITELKQLINSKIEYYQSIAPKLLRELYVDNTLSGITITQSDQLFDLYSDVILRVSQGAFPSAIYRLQQKKPSGFVTQILINNWISKIQKYL